MLRKKTTTTPRIATHTSKRAHSKHVKTSSISSPLLFNIGGNTSSKCQSTMYLSSSRSHSRRYSTTTTSSLRSTPLSTPSLPKPPQSLIRRLFSSISSSDPSTLQDKYSHTVSLFTKDNCSLCVPVKQTILNAQKKYDNFRYVEVDIKSPEHKQYYQLYKWDIPVVHIDGHEYCRHFIDDDDFDLTISQLK